MRPLWSSGKTLAANAGGRGFTSHRGHKHLFFTFYSIRVECDELFCKTNIKLLKLFSYILLNILDLIKVLQKLKINLYLINILKYFA